MFYSIKVINFGKSASTFRFYFADGKKTQQLFRTGNPVFALIWIIETAISETVFSELCNFY
jgi:hypothetical protein